MKKLIVMFLSALFIFIIMNCDGGPEMETWNVTVNVYNNSDYDVTDIWISGIYKQIIPKLDKDKDQTLSLVWEEFKNTKIGQRIELMYNINGKQFDVENQKDAVWFKNLPIGHWEWEENGVKYEVTLAGESNQGENEGSFLSLKHFTNGAKIDIFIENEGYRIEGGTFQKIGIPPLPPWLRDDYPESYFEFDSPPRS